MDWDHDFSQYLEEVEEDFYNQQNSPENDLSKPYIECLKKSFGHSSFRGVQWKIISSVLDRKQDNCAILATGYGKSLCYQFPSVYLNTVTLVVSPLISLMEDQVLSLTMSNIKACFLGSAQKDRTVIDRVLNFEYNLVYLTPELITSDFGEKILKTLRNKLTLIAIDEAHCVSQWDHDFRTAFRSLGKIRKLVNDVPILAMTARATDRVKNDIINCLALRTPQITCTGFDRPNLEFNVRLKGGQGTWADLGAILHSVRTIGSTIIYCITKKQTDEVAAVLKSHGVQCKAYHAGLYIKQRNEVHEQFIRGSIRTIVATIAFGIRIDKPDVRLVIHYGASKDLESYYQEIGHAGRDGMSAKCIMLYSRADLITHQFMREKTTNSQIVAENLEIISTKMRDYINTTDCRRLYILRYFEGPNAKCSDQIKNCCDNCRSNNRGDTFSSKYEDLDDKGLADYTKDSLNLLKAISAFNGSTGIGIPLLLLRGSKDQKLSRKYYEHEVYGAEKAKSDDYFKSLATLLEDNKYLRKEQIHNTIVQTYQKMRRIHITDKAESWIRNPNRSVMKLKPAQDMLKYLKKKKRSFLMEATSSTYNLRLRTNLMNASNSLQDLLRSLFKVRIIIANKEKVMPYIIASNKAIIQLSTKKPLSLEQMRKENLDGFSEAKVTKFGPEFLKCISQFQNFLPADNEKTSKGGRVDTLSLLLASLFKVRTIIANKENVMPDTIASNKAIIQLSTKKPLSLEQMRKENLDGFSEAKVTKFGTEFLKCISQFQNFLPADNEKTSKGKGGLVDTLSLHPVPGAKIGPTHFSTYVFWSSGKSILEIAQLRGLEERAISKHLSELIKSGHCCTKSQINRMGVDNHSFKLILSKIPSNCFSLKLTEIKQRCPPNITFDMVKYVLAYQQVREHLQNLDIPFIDPDQKKKILNNTFNKSALLSTTVPNAAAQSPREVIAVNSIEKPTDHNNENLCDSDTEIDFEDIDEAIGRANTSISGELNTTVTSGSTLLKTESGELIILEHIQKDKSDEGEHKLIINPLKRRLTPKQNIIYEASSEEENDTSPQISRKRVIPSWMFIKNAQKSKRNFNKNIL